MNPNRREFLQTMAVSAAGLGVAQGMTQKAEAVETTPGQLKAGAARIVISPTKEMLPLPQSPLNGDAWYTWVRKDIYARAVALQGNGRHLLLITVEGHFGDGEVIKKKIAEQNGIPADSIVLLSEHTHTQPNIVSLPAKEEWGVPVHPNTIKYTYFVIDQIVKVGGEALRNLRPARIGFGRGKSFINVSRDEQLPDGRWIFGRNFDRPSDKTLDVIALKGTDGKLVATILNHAVHSTMCFRVKDKEGNLCVSGDLAGEIAEYVEEACKSDGAICAWTMGAAANQTPILSFFHTYNPDGSYEPDERYNRFLGTHMWELCRHLGQKQGMDAVQILKGITHYRDQVKLDYIDRQLWLPGTRVVGFGKPELLDDRLVDSSKVHSEDVDTKYNVDLKLLLLGELALFCSSGEVVCETGERLKNASPYKNMVFMTLYNSRGAGYQVDKWGYENRTPVFYRNVLRNACYEDFVTPAMMEMYEALLNR